MSACLYNHHTVGKSGLVKQRVGVTPNDHIDLRHRIGQPDIIIQSQVRQGNEDIVLFFQPCKFPGFGKSIDEFDIFHV